MKSLKSLKSQTPAEIDRQLDGAYNAKRSAQTTIARILRDIQRRGSRLAMTERDHAAHSEAEVKLAEAQKIIDKLEAEFDRRGGWERSFIVTNGNGHAHRSMSCTTCYPTTTYAWVTALSGLSESAIINHIGETACTICYPTSPVAQRTPAERKSMAAAAVAARKAEKAEIKRQKELAKVPRAHAAAIKVDALVNAFGLNDDKREAYSATYGEGPFGKGYDTAYQTYSDMARRRVQRFRQAKHQTPLEPCKPS